ARPADAMVLADALRNSMHGIAPIPATAPTVHLGTSASTRVLPNREPPTSATRAATRREQPRATPPRQVRGREPARAPREPPTTRAGQRAGERSGRSRAGRRLATLFGIALLYAAAVARSEEH